ncbi:hypothetical protein F4678DRAFT_447740 [Xylaria arbuscula]|nr:hypothetical protein F4678DRAFT_447740 [Xylaria arbuscula]
MPSMQSTIILATALLGSLAAAAPEASSIKRGAIQFPDCISTCMRNSGCFDAKCICSGASDGILSDIVICMNQWCPATVTAKDLISPLEGQCDLPKSAVQDAEKIGGVADDSSADEPSSTSTSAKATATTTATPTAGNKGGDDNETSSSKNSSSTKTGNDAVIQTFDVGSPQTNAAASPTTTVKPVISGTLTVTNAAASTITDDAAATETGLLTDDDAQPTLTGSLGGTATLVSATPSTSSSSSAANAEASGSSEGNHGNAAGHAGQASIFGIVAAMGVALALGY